MHVVNREISLEATFPSTKIGFGPLQFDVFEQLTGRSLNDLLAPVTERVLDSVLVNGSVCQRFRLRFKHGDAVTIDLKRFGAVVIGNFGGGLSLGVPIWVSPGVATKLAKVIVKGPSRDSIPGSSSIDIYIVDMPPGFSAGVPLGQFGTLGLKAL